MVRATGLEPACLTTYEPKSYVSANSTTPAYSYVPLFLHGEATEVELIAWPTFIRTGKPALTIC